MSKLKGLVCRRNNFKKSSSISPHVGLKNILDDYVKEAPNDQNALDIFKCEWSSKLPAAWKSLQAGTIGLFEDQRIIWAAEQVGGFEGKRILELGPLEAGHSYMVEIRGAESILAIEANKRAYLKCLIIKEILNLKRSHFLLGDFISFLKQNTLSFDLVLASGVLYHMNNPAELIHLISKVSSKLVLWTHYYEKAIIENNPTLTPKFSGSNRQNYLGFDHVVYKYFYSNALKWDGFCGGSNSYSYWISKDDILACLRFFGFKDLRINFDQPHHQNGPSFCVVGLK